MTGKKWYQSKEIWAGIVLIVTGIGAFATGEQSLQELIMAVIGAVFTILRLQTSQPIIK